MTVYTNNRILPVRVENIPQELKVRPQWVVWKALGEKPDKVPYAARTGRKASSTDLMTWVPRGPGPPPEQHPRRSGGLSRG